MYVMRIVTRFLFSGKRATQKATPSVGEQMDLGANKAVDSIYIYIPPSVYD